MSVLLGEDLLDRQRLPPWLLPVKKFTLRYKSCLAAVQAQGGQWQVFWMPVVRD